MSDHVTGTMNCVYYKSQGFSMEPFLLDGDELIVNMSPGLSYAGGDIVLYRSPLHEQPIAHRLVQIDRRSLSAVFRSDAHPLMVESLGVEVILGRVEFVRRGERLVRVHGSLATRLSNRAVAALLPSVVLLKERVTGILRPAVTGLQGLSYYQSCFSRLFTPEIRVVRLEGGEMARVIATVNSCYAGSLDVQSRSVDGTRVGWISSLSVRLRYRGIGIATRLLGLAEDEVKQQGIQELWVEYEKGNRIAETLYQKQGFQTGIPGVHSGYANSLFLRKVLIVPDSG